jgi:hypothetical protein
VPGGGRDGLLSLSPGDAARARQRPGGPFFLDPGPGKRPVKRRVRRGWRGVTPCAPAVDRLCSFREQYARRRDLCGCPVFSEWMDFLTRDSGSVPESSGRTRFGISTERACGELQRVVENREKSALRSGKSEQKPGKVVSCRSDGGHGARRGANRGCSELPRGLLDPAGLRGAGALPGSAPLARFEAGFGEGGRKRA